VDGSSAGLAVINEAKFGYDVSGNDIGVTIARSPVYAWHDPRELSPDETYSYQDQGRQEFRYLLVPHAGDWRAAGLVRRSAELAQPAQAMLESFHEGPLPAESSFASISDGSVTVSAIKQAEEGTGDVVVRAHEFAGREQRARIDLPVFGRTIEAEFRPFEIKTFLIPRDPTAPVAEVDLLEFPN
jgi:alpha-mannosidase